MKLASMKHSGADGRLVVVNRALTKAAFAENIVPTLREALDNWDFYKPKLQELSNKLETEVLIDAFTLDFAMLSAPLPRAAQFLDASGYLNHIEIARRAAGDELPDNLEKVPLMYQGAPEPLCGPRDPILAKDESWGMDFEAESAVITTHIPMGATPIETEQSIRLIMLMNDVSARRLARVELDTGFGFIHGKPPSAFSAVAVTPDELDNLWDGKRLHGRILSTLNRELIGDPDCGIDMHFSYPELLSYAASTRHLGTGTILGSGTVSNFDRARGSSCLLERRMIEKIDKLERRTELLKFGDIVRIEMQNTDGSSIFGAIEQKFEKSNN